VKIRFGSLLPAAIACLVTLPVSASERHFTYTYETAVLNPGDLEIEPWQTARIGREKYFTRYDLRLEFEYGVVENLQTAIYWNFKSVTKAARDSRGRPTRDTKFSFNGISSEWKYKLLDSVADPIGFGLYFEATAAPTEAELELKLLFDKKIGPWLVAFNAVGEYEWKFEAPGDTVREVILAPVLGAGYLITPHFMAGIEVRNHTEFISGEGFEHSAFFAGPAFSYAQDSWWTALTILPQLAAIKSDDHEGEGARDLHDHERIEIRLLLGMHVGGT
jgi:hypothetical protein